MTRSDAIAKDLWKRAEKVVQTLQMEGFLPKDVSVCVIEDIYFELLVAHDRGKNDESE